MLLFSVCVIKLQLIGWKKVKIHTSFQAVDVLRVHPQKLPLIVEQPHKIMGQVGLVAPWIQLFGQSKERIWVVMEKVNLKYGLGIGQVVLPQVVIETATWRPVKQTYADSEPMCTIAW